MKGLAHAIINLGIKRPGNLAILDSNTILRSLGGNVFDKTGNLRLENYITHLEDNLEVIICMGDTSAHSTWTRMCISHVSHCFIASNMDTNNLKADVILLLGMADNGPSLTEMERTVQEVGTVAQTELVLLHSSRHCPPGLTTLWLKVYQYLPRFTNGLCLHSSRSGNTSPATTTTSNFPL